MRSYDYEVFGNYRRVLAAFGELLMEGVSEFREELYGYTASI